jgi:hypothetical protein
LLRDDKGEDVLNKDVVGCDSVVDLDIPGGTIPVRGLRGSDQTVVVLADIGDTG